MGLKIENGMITGYSGQEADLVIPEGVTKIADNVFEGHTEIVSVVFPEGLQEIGKESFMGCTSLQDVSLPDSVTAADSRAFYQCGAVQSVRLSKGLKKIGDQCFMGTAISSIELPFGLRYIGSGLSQTVSS
ncbi:MAG: leucine-rich repeat domain-containing protein [Solobacterium sp.]|nr:leucine-rich repeat domain-containing protein [Solobacterium sp.]